MSTYQFKEHRHNYAVWTAARAAQRGFTVNTDTVREAIEGSGMREFVEDDKEYSQDAFEVFHLMCAYNLMDFFKAQGARGISYGRVAKIIAIYLKTAVIMCNQGACRKSAVIHPPIDRILLKNLSKNIAGLEKLALIRWTALTPETYWKIVDLIRERFGSFNWRLEEFWKV